MGLNITRLLIRSIEIVGIDLSFRSPGERFNVRCAAIIKHEGHILCDNERGIDFSFLPGGRIKRGELSAEALQRELAEELNAQITVRSPLIIAESFFTLDNERFHELAFYFEVERPKNIPFVIGKDCHSHEDGGNSYFYRWIEATPEALAQVDLKPGPLRAQFIDLPQAPMHVILDE
ncbi:NUDIX hydrolase [Maritalea porphyrae]|uniref:NUDIX hydrolase n=1 Tax=Maritalea porphyrae TaxID=880732 RepID=UPI0022B06FB8|nr:NUDIX domain-containing protein [Maritalea porphyrae]MCZ4273674.1 NUDIX domain-containing protein [Maritalea porphyrae]